MASPIVEETQLSSSSSELEQTWSPLQRVAFRFACIYIGLYVLFTQMLLALLAPAAPEWSSLDTRFPVRQIVSWIAFHLFRHRSPLVVTGSGSGDKTFDWVEAFSFVAVAALLTCLWSLVGKRQNYGAAHNRLRVLVRLALGSTLLTYAFAKIVPTQMTVFLQRFVEPFGNFSPMGVLWSSIASAVPYEIFAGCAELLGGVLVLMPRTATLGALICLADMVQVFMLNMTYDIPVKLFSFHLILLSLFLLVPEAGRLSRFFFSTGTVAPAVESPLFVERRANRIATFAQYAFLAYLIGSNLYSAVKSWKEFGPGASKSALYGIWNVDECTLDGQPHPPLLTDTERWRRVIFQFRSSASFQRMDDTFAYFGTVQDMDQSALVLTKPGETSPFGKLAVRRPTPDQLILAGSMGGHQVHMTLQLVNSAKFLLTSRGFHWVQEYPFNR
jgi:hypothetical protein